MGCERFGKQQCKVTPFAKPFAKPFWPFSTI
jgi:hypothetical protein